MQDFVGVLEYHEVVLEVLEVDVCAVAQDVDDVAFDVAAMRAGADVQLGAVEFVTEEVEETRRCLRPRRAQPGDFRKFYR